MMYAGHQEELANNPNAKFNAPAVENNMVGFEGDVNLDDLMQGQFMTA